MNEKHFNSDEDRAPIAAHKNLSGSNMTNQNSADYTGADSSCTEQHIFLPKVTQRTIWLQDTRQNLLTQKFRGKTQQKDHTTVQVKGKLVSVLVSGSTAPRILKLGTRLRWVVNYALRHLQPRSPLDKETMWVPELIWTQWRKEETADGNRTPVLHPAALSLYWLGYPCYVYGKYKEFGSAPLLCRGRRWLICQVEMVGIP
jgi:hypothetical protein